MAQKGLFVLGVVILLNFTLEVRGDVAPYKGIVIIRDANPIVACVTKRLNYTVEFQQIQFNDSSIYRRKKIGAGATSCLTSNTGFAKIPATSNTLLPWIKETVGKGTRTVVCDATSCSFMRSSLPKDLITCTSDEGYKIAYTTSDTPEFYTASGDDSTLDDCEVTVDDSSSSITVTGASTGTCASDEYHVMYEDPAREADVIDGMPYKLSPALLPCKMVNFTISRRLGKVHMDSGDKCVASVITNPAAPTRVIAGPSVAFNIPNCEYLEYTVLTTKDGTTTSEGPHTAVGQILNFLLSVLAGSTVRIKFSTDVNIKVPDDLVYP